MTFSYQESSGASGGSSSSSSSQSSQSGTLPWYNNYVQDLLKRGQEAIGSEYQAGPDRVAGLNADQQTGFGMVRDNAGKWMPGMQQAADATQGALGTLQGLQNSPYTQGALNSYSQMVQGAQWDPNRRQDFMNPYTSGVVDEIARLGNENFQNNTLSTLNDNFVDAGKFGSARHMAMVSDAAARNQREISGAQAKALESGYNTAGQEYSDWENKNQQALQSQAQGNMGINQFLSGLGTTTGALGNQLGDLAKTQQGLGLTDANAQLGIGQTQQDQTQKELDAGRAQFTEGQNYPWEQLNNWKNLFGVPTPTNSSSSSNSSSSQANYQSSNGWGTSFAEGGLVGGDGVIDPIQLMQLANLQDRADLRELLLGDQSLVPMQAGSWLGDVGSAMMASAAQGPTNLGQLIGRAGVAYDDRDMNRRKFNADVALKKYATAADMLGKLGGGANSGYRFSTRVDGDGNVVIVDNMTGKTDVTKRADRKQWGSIYKERLKFYNEQRDPAAQDHARRDADAAMMNAPLDGMGSGTVADLPAPQAANGPTAGLTPGAGTPIAASAPAPAGGTATPAAGALPPATKPAPAGMPANDYLDPAQEAANKEAATQAERLFAKDYEDFTLKGARQAPRILSIANALKTQPWTGDIAAPIRGALGDVFKALNIDHPYIDEAVSQRSLRPMLEGLANSILQSNAGVQTEGDAMRAKNEFMKITDPKEAIEYIVGWASENARRMKAYDEFTLASKDNPEFFHMLKKGAPKSWGNIKKVWEHTDFGKSGDKLVAYDKNGNFWTFSDFIRSFRQANPKASVDDAIDYWRSGDMSYQRPRIKT